MTEYDLILELSQEALLTPREAYGVLEMFKQIIKQALVEDGEIMFKSFGKFKACKMKAGYKWLPKIKERRYFDESIRITFNPSKEFKILVNMYNEEKKIKREENKNAID